MTCFIFINTEISQKKAGDKAKTMHPLQSLRGIVFVTIQKLCDPKASFSSKLGQQVGFEMEAACHDL